MLRGMLCSKKLLWIGAIGDLAPAQTLIDHFCTFSHGDGPFQRVTLLPCNSTWEDFCIVLDKIDEQYY